MRTSRFQLPRLVAVGAALALLALIIISAGGRDRSATASARAVMREVRPQMLAAAYLHTTCAPDRATATRCSVDDFVDSKFGRSMGLSEGRGCVAPGSACVSVENNTSRFEIVSRSLPRIGGIRVQATITHGSSMVEWQCVPLRVDAGDERLAKRACGDVPLA